MPLIEEVTLLDQEPKPIYYIVDFRDVAFSMDDILFGTNVSTKQSRIFKHPNIRATLFVTKSSLLSLVAKGLSSQPFGNIAIKVFGTLEEAMTYANQ